MPWLSDVIRVSLDPFNASACTGCSDLISQILDYDISDAQLAPLLESLVGVFTSAVASVCIPVVKHPQSPSSESDSGVGWSFLVRQLHHLLSVLRNLLLFKDYLTPLVLMKFGWTSLSVKCLPSLCKVLASSEFQVSRIVLFISLYLIFVLLECGSSSSAVRDLLLSY